MRRAAAAGERSAPAAMPPSTKAAANCAGARPAEQHVADLLKRLEVAEARHKVCTRGSCRNAVPRAPLLPAPMLPPPAQGRPLRRRSALPTAPFALTRTHANHLQGEKECLLKEHRREMQEMKDKFSERNNTLVKSIDQLRHDKKQAQLVAATACDELKKVRILLSVTKEAQDEAAQDDSAGCRAPSPGCGGNEHAAPAAPAEPSRATRAKLRACEGQREEVRASAPGNGPASVDDKENILNHTSSKAPAKKKAAPRPVRCRVLSPSVLEAVPEEEDVRPLEPDWLDEPSGAQAGTSGCSDGHEQDGEKDANVFDVPERPAVKQHLQLDADFQEDPYAPTNSQATPASSLSKLRRRASFSLELQQHGVPGAQDTSMLCAEIRGEKGELELDQEQQQDWSLLSNVEKAGCSDISGEEMGAKCAHGQGPQEHAEARGHKKEREPGFEGEASGEGGTGDGNSPPQRKRDSGKDGEDPTPQTVSEGEGRQLRKRESLVSYAEPSLHEKLRQGDAHTFNSGENLFHFVSGVLFPVRVGYLDVAASVRVCRLRYWDQEEDAAGNLQKF